MKDENISIMMLGFFFTAVLSTFASIILENDVGNLFMAICLPAYTMTLLSMLYAQVASC